MKSSTPTIHLPERVCTLWGGFAAFMIAFIARLLASGDPASAVFSGCVGCLIGGWLGKLVGNYLETALRPTPIVDDRESADDPASEATPRSP